VSRGRHRVHRLGRGTTVLLVVAALLVVGLGGSAVAAYRYDLARTGRILPGVAVEGVLVGGMSRDQALRSVSREARQVLNRRLVVRAAGRTWEPTLAELGLRADVASAVDRALSLSDSFTWVSRTYHRLTARPVQRSFRVAYVLDQAKIEAFIRRVAGQVMVPARDASYSLRDGTVIMTHARVGRALRAAVARDRLREAVLERAAVVTLPMRPVRPRVPDDRVGKLIVVNLSTNTLTLYDRFKPVRRYPVGTARPGFLTPPGAWKVVAKVMNPTWHNPAPDGWGKGEPLVIPPGPDNPLGTRALYLDAPGIRIHGTPDDASVGHYVSHGCIRMHISQSEELYPLVPVGTPVFIIGAPPWGITSNPGTPGT
jgi:lipoprotein-anchoring transpeptidase ErfK/SrfK